MRWDPKDVSPEYCQHVIMSLYCNDIFNEENISSLIDHFGKETFTEANDRFMNSRTFHIVFID